MISERAEISKKARIGNNIKIGAFTYIEEDVEIGDNTWIGTNVTIYNGARIGSNCKIFPGAVISAEPQDLKYKGENTYTLIGDNTTLRECTTINKGTKAKGLTAVGNNSLIMAYTHISHDCNVGNNCILSNAVQLGGEVEVEDWAVIGGMTAVHQFCKIGKHAMVSGMSGVLSDIPPYLKVAGFPVIYKGINYVGLKRRNFDQYLIEGIHETYRVLYQHGLNTSQAIAYIQEHLPDFEERTLIIDFIKRSTRGIIRK